MGPSAGAFGTAAYANIPTRPIKNSSVLSERFIDFLLIGSHSFPLARGKKCKEWAYFNTSLAKMPVTRITLMNNPVQRMLSGATWRYFRGAADRRLLPAL